MIVLACVCVCEGEFEGPFDSCDYLFMAGSCRCTVHFRFRAVVCLLCSLQCRLMNLLFAHATDSTCGYNNCIPHESCVVIVMRAMRSPKKGVG